MATQIDELRQMLEQDRSILTNLQKRLDKLTDSLSLALVILSGERPSDSEIDEVRRLARQKGISVAEMFRQLKKQGTLPPNLKKFYDALRRAKQLLTE